MDHCPQSLYPSAKGSESRQDGRQEEIGELTVDELDEVAGGNPFGNSATGVVSC